MLKPPFFLLCILYGFLMHCVSSYSGLLYVCGGSAVVQRLNSAERLDPETLAWKTVACLTAMIIFHHVLVFHKLSFTEISMHFQFTPFNPSPPWAM